MAQELTALKGSLSKRTFREQLADRLAHMIQSGLLRPGDELPSERDLVEMLEVSRQTVRGAVQTLAAVGMVEISQGTRTRVLRSDGYPGSSNGGLQVSAYTAEVVYKAREVVELALVRGAAEAIAQPDLDRLHRLVDAQAEMWDDPVRFQIADAEFHELIYSACGNPLLAEYMRTIYSYALHYRRQALLVAGAVERSWQDHVEILAALDAHDSVAAVAAMKRHLCRVHETTLLAMQNHQ